MDVSPVPGGPEPAGLNASVNALFSEPGANVPERAIGPYDDIPKLTEFYKQAKRECLEGRAVQERLWWRNFLYLVGRQWIYWDRRRGQWVDKRMAKWIPRPVTNKVSTSVESLVALFSSIALETTARPNGGNVKNMATAETVDRLTPFLHEDHQMDDALILSDFNLVLFGNAYLHTFYDKNPQWGTISAPYATCETCKTSVAPNHTGLPCKTCGATMVGMQADLPVGKGRTIACSPFEIAAPLAYTEFEDSPLVLKMGWRTKRQWEHLYGRAFVEKMRVSWGTQPTERSLSLLRSMSTMSDVSSSQYAYGLGTDAELSSEGLTEFELWAKPCDDYPEGLLLRAGGDDDEPIIVQDDDVSLPGPLPFETQQGEKILPFMHYGFKPVAGRQWANGPIDVICQKVDQLNRLDSLTELITTRMANPVWLEPKGAEVKSFTGEPGLVIKYNPLAAGGAKPERMDGLNIQASLFQLREQISNDIEELAGTYDALKGTKPSGVEAFSALQLLVERGQARFAPVFKSRGKAYRRWVSIALEMERQYGPTARTFAALSPNGGWTFQTFQNAQLQGAVDIIIEDGSQAPKTNLGYRAAVQQLKDLGMLDPSDVEQKYAIYRKLGLSELQPSLDFHVKSALAEQDAFENWARVPQNVAMAQMAVATFQQQQAAAAATPPAVDTVTGQVTQPPQPQLPEVTPLQAKEYQDGRVHIAEHTKWANSDTGRQLLKDPAVEMAFLRHLELHDILDATRIMRQQLAQMQAQVALGLQPAPAGGGGGGQAMAASNSESGATDDVPAGNAQTAQNQGPV